MPSSDPRTAGDPAGPNIIDSETAAKLLMCTPEWLRRLTKDGWIKKVTKDQYLIVDVVQGYIGYLKDENRKATKTASAKRVQDARAQEIELRIAREQHKLIEMEEVDAFLNDAIGMFRSELFGVPAACTRDLALRAVIDNQVNHAIDRLRDSFDRASGQLKKTGQVQEDGDSE